MLSIGYRPAPEHPWPASVDDAVTVLRWVAGGGAEGRVARRAVSGGSAGGTLAALACLRLRDEAPAALPDAQVLFSPNADLRTPLGRS